MIREHYPKMAEKEGRPELIREVNSLLPRVYEFSELLVDKLGVEDTGAYFPHLVTFHPSCHSLRSLYVGDKPQRLLRKVRGLTYVELADADQCCGFGGTFCVAEEAISVKMGVDRVTDHTKSGAEYITSPDLSCLMHLEGILHRNRSKLKIIHIAEILNSAL